MTNTPILYLLVGYPGSGKTTTSKFIHELTGAVHLWADHERSRRFEHPTHDHQENIDLYGALNRETRDLLRAGKSVIFDTNFNFYKDRKKLRVLAAKEGAQSLVIWVQAPLELARKRATEHSDNQETRIWGNMPLERFERISSNLQPPKESEQPIILDGQSLTREIVANALADATSRP